VRSNSRATTRDPRGIALAWTAILLVVLLGMVGLSIDLGKVVWNVQQLQNAADAAALAGAQLVREDRAAAITRTCDFAGKNEADRLPVTLRTTFQSDEPFTGDDPALDILLGRWVRSNRTFIATLDAPNAVKAVARRNANLGGAAPALMLMFGPIFGTRAVDAAREAIAYCPDSEGSGFVCLSDVPGQMGLVLGGNAKLDVDDGGIHINAQAGASVSGDARIDCGFINVVGAVTPEPNAPAWEGIFLGGADGEGNDGGAGFTVADVTSSPAPQFIPDPLAAVLKCTAYVAPSGDRLDLNALLIGTPPPLATYDIPTITANATLTPGYYPNGVRISNGVTVTLAPTATSGLGTLFIFGGGPGAAGSVGTGLIVNGGTLTGYGVTCYVTKNISTGVLGALDFGANAVVDLWSPGDWRNRGALEPDPDLVRGLNGLGVWQDPTMVDAGGNTPEVHLNGSPRVAVHGTLYFPAPIHLVCNGNLGQWGSQILCGSADIRGDTTISLNYDGRNSPGPSYRSFLVD
jgi:hypothetical protein